MQFVQPASLKVPLKVDMTLGCLAMYQTYRYQTSKRSSCNDVGCADAGRDNFYNSLDSGILKIVTHLQWVNILNPIICVGSQTFMETYVMGKVQEWVREVEQLAAIANSQPHTAYAAMKHGLSS